MISVERTVTIEHIRRALAHPLPGIDGQKRMAPQPPDGQPSRWDRPENCREAGVLLMFYPGHSDKLAGQSELYLILTRRNEYPGVHSGQISLPGGRRESGEWLQETALRETHEEIGILPESLEMLGQLSPLYIPPSNFCIYPFVAYSVTYPKFQRNEKEVAELVETPVRLLLNPAIYKEEVWHFQQYGARRVPFFDVFGHRVWGATAMILSELLTLLDEDRRSIG